MTVTSSRKRKTAGGPAHNAERAPSRMVDIDSAGAGELVHALVRAGRDAMTIFAGGKLPVDNMPARRSTAARVRENLRTTAVRARHGPAKVTDGECAAPTGRLLDAANGFRVALRPGCRTG